MKIKIFTSSLCVNRENRLLVSPSMFTLELIWNIRQTRDLRNERVRARVCVDTITQNSKIKYLFSAPILIFPSCLCPLFIYVFVHIAHQHQPATDKSISSVSQGNPSISLHFIIIII